MSGKTPSAILFDMAGTVVSSDSFHGAILLDELQTIYAIAEANRELSVPCALSAGMARAVEEICHRPYYLHHELMAEGFRHAAGLLGVTLELEQTAKTSARFWSASTANFKDRARTGGGLRHGAIDTLQALRQRGYHLGLVSNIDEREFREFLTHPPFAACFDATLSSEAAGSCKPDPGIFRIALEQAGCAAKDAVFVGDTPAHDIDGAADLGMTTVLISEPHEVSTRAVKSRHRPDYVIRELPELLALFN